MPHETALIGTIAVSLALAFVLGFGATALRLPPLVGYLLAGVLVGPFTPGFVADTGIAQQLAEIGVILLMFGVGIHFSVGDLLAVRRIALPGAIVQIGAATVLGAGMCRLWGWSWGSGLVFGLCLSVASTVVLLRALEDRGLLESVDGKIAVGWLVVEDLVTVIVLVLLPLFASLAKSDGGADAITPTELALAVATTLGKVVAFVVLMFVVGRRVVPWLLWRVARTGSRELFTLAVLALALGIAVGAAALFGISFALGAFIAGMVVNSSELSHEAAKDALPLQDAFSVLFFVAVGMLFDPAILTERPLELSIVVLIIIVGKSLAAFLIVVAFGYPAGTALTISASLAQIGEFSFILVAMGLKLEILPPEGQSLIVAGALISITLNPLAFSAATRTNRWWQTRSLRSGKPRRNDGTLEEPPSSSRPIPRLENHVVLIGFGRVGSVIGDALTRRGVPYVVIEQDRGMVDRLRAKGVPAIMGDATRRDVLAQASIDQAELLVAGTPEAFQVRAIMEVARSMNPKIQTAARSHSESERQYLERNGADLALFGEQELALGLAHYALLRMGCSEAEADVTEAEVRGRPRHQAEASDPE